MFSDFREYDDGATIETDLCIIGAGAAGIAIAREFAQTQRDVLLIESGGIEAEWSTLELNAGSVVGEPYPPLETARLRFFGGTTNHWDGHCRPFDPTDFEKRPWVPYSGWPINRDDLDTFYARAQDLCELGPYEYRPQAWREAVPALVRFDPARVVNRVWQIGPPTRFGQRYREELKQAGNIRVLFHANVVDIVGNDTATAVRELQIRTLEGKSGRIHARTVVLACGGIENPRLLLASRGVMQNGLGNGHDLVGRFFMEHPHAIVAFAVPAVDIARFAVYYEPLAVSGAAGNAVLRIKPGLSERVQRARHLPNACVDMGYGYDRSPGYLALRVAGNSVADGHLPDELGEAVLEMAGDLDGLAAGVYRRLAGERVLWFGANTEQIPNPASRVTLDPTRDALGLPRPRLDWRLTEQDRTATLATCKIVGEELARLGVARMRVDDWLTDPDAPWEHESVRYHHMGTTRMSDDPRNGVVDRDCRVHGIANLYVAGSSIFPTGGYANPTLTIVALALRLADHLKAAGTSHVGIGTRRRGAAQPAGG